MEKYSELADKIIKNVGGSTNIIDLRHCATRLRFQLRDEALANTEILRSTEGVIAVISNMGEYMVVIGERVPYVFDEINKKINLSDSTDSTDLTKSAFYKHKGKFNRILNVLMAGLTPTLNMACASGIIKGITTILVSCNFISQNSGLYILLDGIGSALFYFLPMLLGYNIAKKLEIDPNLGFLIGAILCYPSLNGTDINIFGQVINVTYTNTFLPVVFIVALAAPLDKCLRKYIPELIRSFLVPAIVLTIMIPLGFILVGPIANLLGKLVSDFFNILLDINKWIAGPLFAGFWQIFVLMGIHGTITIVPFMELMEGIPSQVLALIYITTFAQIGAVLAVYIKTKNKKLKSIALPAFISGIFGITEPAIYGVSLPNIKVFICSCIGSAVSGFMVIILNAIEYYYSGLGIFGILGFINPQSPSVLPILISVIIGFIVSFILTYIIYKDDGLKNDIKEETLNTKPNVNENKEFEYIYSPMKGKIIPLSESKDTAFSSGVLGKGVVICPDTGEVVAPCDGVIKMMFPTKHAIGILSDSGFEVLIHIGYNTTNLKGEFFTNHVEQGDYVQKGTKLISFDIESIAKNGYSLETPIVVTNTYDNFQIESIDKERIEIGEEVLIVKWKRKD